MARKALAKKTRFEVFKRDNFTCQYCGKHAPDVVLEVDHIKPVAEGGTNDMLNLITSCVDCNRGKGKRLLKDHKVPEAEFKALKEMEKRREQMEMLLEWREELLKYEEREIDIICREFCGVNESEGDNDYYINHNGRLRLKTLLNTYGFDELLYATRVARARYLWRGVQFAFDKIGGICYNRALQRKDGSHGR